MKKLILNDSKLVRDEDELSIAKNSPKGHVILKNQLGETIYEADNKIVLAGSAFTACKHFGIKPPVYTPSYNEILGLENSVTSIEGTKPMEKVYLFAVGFDGCGKTAKEVKPVNYSSWITPDYLIPLRYQPLNNDLKSSEREKYFGRKLIEADQRIAYYFKAFEDKPVFTQQYLDGTPIDENVYTSERTDEIESIVELHLMITQDDCRDYFNQTIGAEESVVNSISILTAWEYNVNGVKYYQDIRPLTKFNFPNESLIDQSKGLDITYLLYY